jgi:glucose/arabinose dehydrogenase
MLRVASIGLLCAAAFLAGCGGNGDEQSPPTTTAAATTEREAPPSNRRSTGELARSRGGPRVQTVATGLDTPWEIAFLPDGRALITERGGDVLLRSRSGSVSKVGSVARTTEIGEGGLLGIAVDLDFDDNRFVYMYRTTGDGNEVVRFRFEGGRLREEATIARGIAAAGIHDGGRIHFGPDGRLYFSAGDAANQSTAQDPNSLNGKILRLDESAYHGDGARPEVFSMGHRNPQGFGWQPGTDRLYENEHGAAANDELNLLRKGANYGWPEVEGGENRDGFTAPLAFYTETLAPSGSTFVTLPGSEWTGDYLIGCLAGQQIRRVRFDGTKVEVNEPLFQGEFGRIRTVVEGPDGALYALTNNTDGRGDPGPDDDRLLRIVPPSS